MSQAGNSKLMTSSLVKCFCRLSFVVLDGHLVRVSMAAHSSLLQWFQQRWRHLQILQFQTCREIAMYEGNDSMHGKTLQLLLQALAAITICLATHNFGQYSGIFTSVQEKLNNSKAQLSETPSELKGIYHVQLTFRTADMPSQWSSAAAEGHSKRSHWCCSQWPCFHGIWAVQCSQQRSSLVVW